MTRTTAIFTIVTFYGRSPRLIDRGFRLYRGCGFRPLRSFRGHSVANTINKDAVLLRAHAQQVSSGTVVKCFRQGRRLDKSKKLHARAKLK